VCGQQVVSGLSLEESFDFAIADQRSVSSGFLGENHFKMTHKSVNMDHLHFKNEIFNTTSSGHDCDN